MDDTYPSDIYQDDRYDAPEPKKGPSGWLIAFIVLLVLIVGCSWSVQPWAIHSPPLSER
jgi:hypothetical protein